MEILKVFGQQYFFLFPIGFVLVWVALVFVFGFKSSVKFPNFKHLSFSSDDKKSKKKSKDKVCMQSI